MINISENQTRKQCIDPILERVGWRKEYVIEELNSIKSNFKTKEFKFIGDDVKEGENRFIDYLLLDDKRTPQLEKNDIPDILERFRKRKKEDSTDRKKKCFVVPIDEIRGNIWDLSLSKYKEFEYEVETYREPDVILEEIGKVHLEIG